MSLIPKLLARDIILANHTSIHGLFVIVLSAPVVLELAVVRSALGGLCSLRIREYPRLA